ncbi:uncharacterized protein LOC144279079 isoform X2 [Eretmochelys imbricata]
MQRGAVAGPELARPPRGHGAGGEPGSPGPAGPEPELELAAGRAAGADPELGAGPRPGDPLPAGVSPLAGPPRRPHGVAAAGREAAGLAGHPGGRPPLPPAAVEPDLPAGALGAQPAPEPLRAGWCIKSQLVDLLKQGLWEELLDNYQPEIYISDWWGAREDCGCEYSICVKLLAADGRTVITEFQANPDPIQQWNDARYHQVSYWFRQYGRGVRYVHFLHKGKDTHFWAGHYGARITNSTVMVKLS